MRDSSFRDNEVVLRFADCEVRPSLRQLTRLGSRIHIQTKPYDLLVYLLDNRDRVVTHDELLEDVWHALTVTPQSIRYALHAVRSAIGDDGKQQQLIQTVPGVGLRFTAPVAEVPASTRITEVASSPRDLLFLGRERFTAIAQSLINEVLASRTRGLLISGQPGIGKSTSIDYMAIYAKDYGFSTAIGRCIEASAAPAYWPWVQVLRSLIHLRPAGMPLARLINRSQEIAWLLPELRRYFPALEPSPAMDASSAQFRLFEAISTLINRASQESPILICMDDLQKADKESLLLFEHLLESLPDIPVLIVGAHRDAEGSSKDPLRTVLRRITPMPRLIQNCLDGLREPDIAALAIRMTGLRPSPRVLKDLAEKTNGNPFFLKQLLKFLENLDIEAIAEDRTLQLNLPPGVQEAIIDWLRFIPADVRHFIDFAAVAGREFSPSVVRKAMNIASADLAGRLDAAIGAGVVAVGNDGSHYRFIHLLVQEAIYSNLPTAVRGAMHLETARAIQSAKGLDAGPLNAELARHYAKSPEPYRQESISYLAQASDWEINNAAFSESITHLENAISILRESSFYDQALHCQLLIKLGRAHGLIPNRSDSRRCLAAAATYAKNLGRDDLLAEASIYYSPDLLAIETGVYDQDLVALLEEALGFIAPNRHPERARLAARLAVALHWSDEQWHRIPSLLGEAAFAAGKSRDEDTKRYVETAGELALYSVATASRRMLSSATSILMREANSLPRAILRVTSLLQMGNVRKAEIEIANLADLIRALSRPSAAWYLEMFRGTIALLQGRYQEAGERRERFLKEGLRVHDANVLHSFALQHAMEALDVGGLENVEAGVVEMTRRFPRVEGWQAGLGYLLLELGRHNEGRVAFHRAIEEGLLRCRPRNSFFGTLGSLALACEHLPVESGTARRIWARLEGHSGQLAVVGFGSYCWGSVDRFLAVVASRLDDWARAEEHFEKAIAVNSACGALPALAQTRLARARMFLRRGQGDKAREWAEGALEIADELTMSRVIHQACEILDAA